MKRLNLDDSLHVSEAIGIEKCNHITGTLPRPYSSIQGVSNAYVHFGYVPQKIF